MLAAARAGRISLFGELENRPSEDYGARSPISLKRHTYTEIGADNDADISSDGLRLVFSSTRHHVYPDLYIKAVDGTAVTQLTGDPASDVQPAISPDGRSVAFASDRAGSWDIWLMDMNGGRPVRITDDPAEEVHPSWSPKGDRVVFSALSVRGGQWELWIADADGGSGKKFIGYGLFPVWSPRGDKILYQRARERGSNLFSIWSITLVDGEPRYPTELASSAHQAFILPAWRRDGRAIAFASVSQVPQDNESSLPASAPIMDIWYMDADGRGKVRLTDGHAASYAPVFSPDGRIYFTTNRNGFDNIWSLFPRRPSPQPPVGGSLTGDLREESEPPRVELGGFRANDS